MTIPPDLDAGILLVYGPDTGLVRETAQRLVRYFAGAGTDSMGLVTLDGKELDGDPGRLLVEARTSSLFGEKRVGKGLLVQNCCGRLLNGVPVAITTLPENEEELRKKLFSILLEDDRILVFDNVAKMLNSPTLASLLTAPIFRDRVLGTSGSRHAMG